MRLADVWEFSHSGREFSHSVARCCGCRVVDFGSVYASKSFATEDGRRVMLGWAFETAAGCVEQCSLGTNFTNSLVR